ncbi:hypothetical protein [Flavobacterium sp.]|uniref:hypothetical protein n=1 Tax=Flavobacterium sp. TaxID=239 RepID=UPI002B4B0AF6|nr:hypothetical protein [Flavobacterium sp.]HLF51897.1 hypothetical protein [Flavobacterium sp.]
MKIENLITNLETSEKLIKSGVNVHAALSHYKNINGDQYVDFTDLSHSEFLFPAYTSEEIMSLLPSDIFLNENHYTLVDEPNSSCKVYKKHEPSNENHGVSAHLDCTKSDDENSFFVTRYWYNGVIATSITKNGEYQNLICFGDNEAESRAKMYLLLKNENII